MLSRISEKIFISLVLLVLLAWAGYHAFRFYHNPLQTEAVFEYTISQTVVTEGIAFRSEQLIEKPSSGIENYLYEDGTRVSIGQTLTEFYSDNTSDKNVKRMREIEKELTMLLSAQDTTLNNFSNSDIISRDLREKLSSLTEMTSTGSYSQISDLKYDLTSLLNRRQVATGKVENFSERIQALQEEHSRLDSSTANAIVAATSPRSGYFSKQVDGYETILSPELLADYSIDDFKELIESEEDPKAPKRYLGKLANSHTWYFAVVLPKHDVEWVREGQRVTMIFDRVDNPVPGLVHEVKSANDNDNTILIFSSNQMGEEQINLRRSEVSIQFYRYTGLRISRSSMRIVDGVHGVYILDGTTVKFKTVEPIYEDPGYVLSTMNYVNSTDRENVRLFDQVITKGNDLYDGKVIS